MYHRDKLFKLTWVLILCSFRETNTNINLYTLFFIKLTSAEK